MKWITRVHVQVDQAACAWLIRRFIDHDAVFLFDRPDMVNMKAMQLDAIPYAIPGVELGPHGNECAFEAMLRKYRLDGDPALAHMARIINGADLQDSPYDEPESAGLKAIARGFQQRGYHDDHEVIAAQRGVYNALYAYSLEKSESGGSQAAVG